MAEVICLDDSDSDGAPPPRTRASRTPAPAVNASPEGPSFFSTLGGIIESRGAAAAHHLSPETPTPPPPRRVLAKGNGRSGRSKVGTSADIAAGNTVPGLGGSSAATTPSPPLNAPVILLDSDDDSPPATSPHVLSESDHLDELVTPSAPARAPLQAVDLNRTSPAVPAASPKPAEAAAPNTSKAPANSNPKKRKGAPLDAVEVVVAQSLAQTPEGLKLFGLLLSHDEMTTTVTALNSPGSLLWRRSGVPGLAAAAFYFNAQDFTDRMRDDTLAPFARTAVAAYPNIPVYLILVGARAFCRKQARVHMSSAGVSGTVIAESAVSDACTFLYLELGLQAVSVPDVASAATFVARISRAAAELASARALDGLALRAAYARSKVGPSAWTNLVRDSTGAVRPERRSDPGGMYHAFLCLIPGVSPARAKAIRKVFPTLARLADACRACRTEEACGNLLKDVGEGMRPLGRKMSAVVVRVFAGGDCEEDVGGG